MVRCLQILLIGAVAFVSCEAQAYKVHYYQQIETNGITEVISDEVVETGNSCKTVIAPRIEGFIFTDWTISTHQQFEPRQIWGYSYNWCEFVIYEMTTLTAHYLPSEQDNDGDGLADGHEMYWFGDLDEVPCDDLDSDGLLTGLEIKAATNPLFVDGHHATGAVSGMGVSVDYVRPGWYVDPDPHEEPDPDDPNAPVDDPDTPRTFRCIIRSEPEGLLFESTTNWYPFGQQIVTSSYHPGSSAFGCWAVNGVEQRSEYGWALGQASFSMPSNTVEVVAFCEEDRDMRYRLYWYGRDGFDGGDDDRDGDGHTLSEETAAGTNPLLPDVAISGGVASALGTATWYNPSNYPSCTIRSEPEGKYVESTFAYVRPGTVLELKAADGFGCWYWRENGEPFVVSYGDTLATIRYVMPGYDVGLVAYVDDSLDIDGDGYSHAQEVQSGTHPAMHNRSLTGGVASGLGAPVFYNPFNMQSYVMRSEPEGELFATVTNYVRPGTSVTTPSYDYRETKFAYWTVAGIRAVDEFNVSTAYATFTMPSNALEVVAILEDEAGYRERMHYYGLRVESDYDYDGDGVGHAAELQGGTSPMFRNRGLAGGVASSVGAVTWYNPSNYPSCTIMSEPEGRFVATSFEYVRPGTVKLLNNRSGNTYWYWKENRNELLPEFGSTLSEIRYVMPYNDVVLVAYYDGEHDEDGDGFSHDEELAAGMNPYGYDRHFVGGVAWGLGGEVEVDLQPNEQVRGVLMRGIYTELFTSPTFGNEATSRTFGRGLTPVVCDVNDDGRFDFVLLCDGGTNVFVNIGGVGNPEFEERNDVSLANVDLDATSISRLDGFNLDVEPYDGLSCTFGDADLDGVKDLLVSDASGHIWYYRNTSSSSVALESSTFTLQHKVWGGTFNGFANGLKISAVDWDDDGDLDCLCGTAEGKLILLRDPKVGRPTNLRGAVGIDNVLLTWDPNVQSRVRGYKVYRSPANADSYRNVVSPYVDLPNYRDFPGETAAYDYKVTAISRFYTAGNSTPTMNESPATEPIRVQLGSVRFFWNDAATKVGEQVAVMLSIENSMNYDVAGMSETVVYDPEYLRPVKVVKTGLTEECEVVDEVGGRGATALPEGEWQVTIMAASEGGHAGRVTLPAGGGKFLVFVFEALKEGVTTVGGESGATVSIAAASASAPYQLGDVDGDGDVDVEDLRLLAKLKNGTGRKYTANQLKAGDFNGNGKLDNADYQALRALLVEQGKL